MSRRIDRFDAALTLVLVATLGMFALICMAGCTDSARHAYGYTEPKIKASRGILGTSFEASGQLNGNGQVKYDPESKAFEVVFNVQHEVVDVYDAQARRITDEFLEGRRDEYAFKIEAAKVIGNMLNDLARTLTTLGLGLSGADGATLLGAGRALSEAIRPLAVVNVTTNGVP